MRLARALLKEDGKENPMKTYQSLITLSAAAAALTIASAAAHADPVAPVPQHKPENISQVNGQLVEIGNHNKYDYTYKRFNIGTNPLSMLMGTYGVQGSIALNSMVAIRGDITAYDEGFTGGAGVDMTGSAAVYFKQMYQGLFLEPGLVLRNRKESDYYYDDSYNEHYTEESRTSLAFQTLIGYHWMWDSGLNVSVAGGLSRELGSDGNEEVEPAGYMRFGYAF